MIHYGESKSKTVHNKYKIKQFCVGVDQYKITNDVRISHKFDMLESHKLMLCLPTRKGRIRMNNFFTC